MNREDIKRDLENYAYDFEYYIEKTKECEKFKDETHRAIMRIKMLNEHNRKNSVNETQSAIDNIIEQVVGNEGTLIGIMRKKQNIEKVIENLNQPDRTIIYLRYLRFYTFDQIADKMHYSTKRIYQLHAIAIENYVNAFIELCDQSMD